MDAPIFEIVLGSLIIIGPIIVLNIIRRKKHPDEPADETHDSELRRRLPIAPYNIHPGNPDWPGQ